MEIKEGESRRNTYAPRRRLEEAAKKHLEKRLDEHLGDLYPTYTRKETISMVMTTARGLDWSKWNKNLSIFAPRIK